MHGRRVAEVSIFILWGKYAAFGRGWKASFLPWASLLQELVVRPAAAPSCPGRVELEPVHFSCFYLLLNHFDLWREKKNRTFDSVVKALI